MAKRVKPREGPARTRSVRVALRPEDYHLSEARVVRRITAYMFPLVFVLTVWAMLSLVFLVAFGVADLPALATFSLIQATFLETVAFLWYLVHISWKPPR